MRIEPLVAHPGHVPRIAAWHQAEWSALSPERSLASRVRDLAAEGAPPDVPFTGIALDDDDAVLGSASLVHSDMDGRSETPWLASVYVAPAVRRRGVGSALVGWVEQKAREGGFTDLYLFTPDQEALYARLGWSVLSREPYHGHDVVVMRRRLVRAE